MFVAEEKQWRDEAVQTNTIRQHFGAFSPRDNYLSWGHLIFEDQAALALKWVRHIVLVRDPYDLVLARARFFLSDEFEGDLNHLKSGSVSVEELLNMMIFGIIQKAPSLRDLYQFNACAWMGTQAHIVRFEDIKAALRRLDHKDGESFMRELLANCGLDPLPDDWKARVRVGADPANSRTARQNLHFASAMALPEQLPAEQKRLVDYTCPGLRELLGYK
jgi:hypothetical protein